MRDELIDGKNDAAGSVPTASSFAVGAPGADKIPWRFQASGRLAYIDGLRAIAIIAVVAFHSRVPGFRGGFVGVDVFFVISGFLITRQIVSQILAGQFSVTEFYARRILRIFPPLLLVIAGTLAAAPLFPLLAQELRDLATSAAATAAMISNYYFAAGTEYFAPRSEIDPLLHTWSLGVEEQYYLFAPALTAAIVVIASRRKWRPTSALLASGIGIAIASYIVLAILVKTDHRLAFFSVMSRAWQFCVGGLLATAILHGMRLPARLQTAFGLSGLLAICAAVVLYDDHMDYPGLAIGIVPTLGALLLLAAGIDNEASALMKILGSRPAVTVGMLSYSWYLWHWPVIELVRTLPFGGDSVWKNLASSTVALLLSIPTYFFFERPLKSLRQSGITPRFASCTVGAGIAGSAFVALAALALAHSDVLDRNLQAMKIGRPSESLTGCQDRARPPRFLNQVPCFTGGNGDPSVMFWGDSHAGMITPIAEWSARANGQTAVVFWRPACPPGLGIEIDFFTNSVCAAFNDYASAWLEKQRANPIKGVVLAARWAFYDGKDVPTGAAEVPRMVSRDGHGAATGYSDILYGGLNELLQAFSPRVRVLIVGAVPELEKEPSLCFARVQLTAQPLQFCGVERAKVERRRHDVMAVLDRLVSVYPNARLIDPINVFCDRDTCSAFGSDGAIYGDSHHLYPYGAEMIYRRFQSDFDWVYGAGAANRVD